MSGIPNPTSFVIEPNLLMICQIFSPIMPKGAFIQPTEKGYVWYKSS